jgi:hypothetical protein
MLHQEQPGGVMGMKWIVGAVAAVGIGIIGFSVSAPVLSSKAYASRMNGKPYGAHEKSRRAACFNHACAKKKQ